MKLTVKAIIRWEQLNNKPFSLLDYGSEDDVISLFYACQLDNSQKLLSEFKSELSEDKIKELISDFEKNTSFSAQFQEPIKKGKKNSEPTDPTFIKDTVALLVMSGLDVNYVLQDMEFCDLQMYLKAYDQKSRDRLTIERLWTFIQVSPYLNKKIKSPQDLHPFSWEIESEVDSKENEFEFEIFLKSGIKK